MDGATYSLKKVVKQRDTCLDPFHFSYFMPGDPVKTLLPR